MNSSWILLANQHTTELSFTHRFCVQRLDIVTESLSRENKVLLSPEEVSKKVVQTQ